LKLASRNKIASEAVIQNGNGGRPRVPALIEAKVKADILMMDFVL
jgi:hypothetical protein